MSAGLQRFIRRIASPFVVRHNAGADDVLPDNPVIVSAIRRLKPIRQSWPDRMTGQQLVDAIRSGMTVADDVLIEAPEPGRRALWQAYFRHLYARNPNYQCQDFEIADYQVEAVGDSTPIRGPVPNGESLDSGRYICIAGASQFFGRFWRESWQRTLFERFGIPALNISKGGAGPQLFTEPERARYLTRAGVVLVQVLSGRSVGCEEYPGEMDTFRKGTTIPVSRELLLRELSSDHPDEFVRLVEKWQRNYCRLYREIAASIPGRKVLIWISERRPADWSLSAGLKSGRLGRFPQMVTQEMIDELRPHFDAYVECIERHGAPLTFTSRLTGAPCPFISAQGEAQWSTNYYPPPSVHERCFALLEPVIHEMLN